MSDPLQNIRYDRTAADVIATLNRIAESSLVGRSFTRLAYMVIVGLAWASAALVYVKHGAGWFFGAYFVLALCITVGTPRAYGWYQDAFWRSVINEKTGRKLIGWREVSLSSDGIEERGSNTSMRLAFDEIELIELGDDRTHVFAAPLLVLSLPRRAFPDPATYRQFVERLRDGAMRAKFARREVRKRE